MATVPLRERKKQFHELIRRHLAEFGFRKSGEAYILRLTPDATGILRAGGVGRRGSDGTTLEIFSKVAIRHERLEEVLVELGKRANSKTNADMSVHIGYLMPENTYTPWLFEPGVDMTEGALDFVDSVERYAIPYMRAHASLEAVEQEMRSKPKDPDYRYFYPAVLHLLGRYDEALKVLAECIQSEHPDTVRYSVRRDIYDDKMVTHRRQLPPDYEKFRKYKEFADRLTVKIEEARQGRQ